MSDDTLVIQTPYDLVGGAEVVRAIVDRFYDEMESDPAFAELRALHAPDLLPMRISLAGFLVAWLGGPRDWFTDNPGKCMMSVHKPIRIDGTTAAQWAEAMRSAIAASPVEPDLGGKMADALADLALNMGRSRAA